MRGDRFADAIQIGRQALEMATELELDEVRAHALNNIGSARVQSGDIDGIGDTEQSIKVTDEIGSPESLRGYNNLFANHVSVGQLGQAAAAVRAGLVVAERFGNVGPTARWLRFERVHTAYWEGRWDDAMAVIDETFSEVGPAQALSRFAFEMRGRIRLARDDTQGALEDADASLALGRQAKDPQTFFPALSFAAVAALEQGRARDAESLTDELLALRPADHAIAHHISPLFDLAWVAADLGRSGDLIEATEHATARTLHVEAAEALARGSYLAAADIYGRMGSLPNEALARLRAAAQLSAAGRREEADRQLQPALAFWRSVDAKHFVREAEALLPATA